MRSRRRFLKETALAAGLSCGLSREVQAARAGRSVQAENQKEGSTDWQLTRVRIDNTNCRSPWVEGYCSKQSVAADETIEFMVSLDRPGRCRLEIFRMGYYQGRGARLMHSTEFEARPQPLPTAGPKRLMECNWEPSSKLQIPGHWKSGVYLGRLTRVPHKNSEAAWQSYIIFIVRDDRPADFLFKCSDNTWQAYNRWPNRFSLYDDGSKRDWTSGAAVDVSFDRPYGKYRQIYDNPQSVGSGEFLCWEFPMAYWMEKEGYDVTYCSQADMLTPDRGSKCKCLLSIGHDEYWDLAEYHATRALIDSGVSALFLSGNSLCWVTPMTSSTDGRAHRVITRAGPYSGYAGHVPEDGSKFTVTGPDEGLIMGARNVSPVNGGGDWIVTKPGHWIFRGTKMKKGEAIPGLVGWEYHGNPAPLPGLEVVAEGTALVGGETPQHWTATIHPGPKNNFVFNAATIFWAQGLSSPPGHMLPWSHWVRPHGPDARVQRITRNLLERACS